MVLLVGTHMVSEAEVCQMQGQILATCLFVYSLVLLVELVFVVDR